MSYSILPTKEFFKDFMKLDKHIWNVIKNKIEEVAEDPARYKHLHYDLRGSSRIRVGKIRIIFSYNAAKKELYLEKVVLGHRYRE